MPIGGANIGTWDEGVPDANESVGLGDDRIRSTKSTVRTALDSEHVWSSSGGTVGQHRYGSARAFYGAQSAVSASDTSVVADGRMMIASDTSRLFGVGSTGTVLLGPGPLGLSVGSYAPVTFPQRLHCALETGESTSASSLHVVTFASAFSATSFTCHNVDATDGNGVGISNDIVWSAIGHRAL